ncbi:MAG: hypothetical protein NXI35_05755 [bacterium]|nr:hypothetical protein [bacterium]
MGRLRSAEIWSAWWPLAASWLLMGLEQPAIAAVIARLPDPKFQLGAYGSVVFPIALLIEAPIIMLLAASTELSRDRARYATVVRYTRVMGVVLTGVHLLVAATPLGPWIIGAALSVPASVAEAARPGLWLMVPWSWAIAARRTGQGLLIRQGRSRLVGIGTGVRLVASSSVLAIGLATEAVSGVVIGTAALAVGVLSEAAFVGVFARQAAATLPERSQGPALTLSAFVAFYVPLALTPVVALVIQPIGTAAISRMPEIIESLAVWPVIVGLAFVVQSVGLGFNEVVVALVSRPGGRAALWRFAWRLATLLTVLWLAFALSPVAAWWFGHVANLPSDLMKAALVGLVFTAPQPAMRVLQSWYQGLLVSAHRTRPITEAVVVFGLGCGAVLVAGLLWQGSAGVYVAALAYSTGRVVQTVWLWWRCRTALA